MRADRFSRRKHPFLFALNHNVSVLPDFKQLLCCAAAVFYSVGSKPISVSIDLKSPFSCLWGEGQVKHKSLLLLSDVSCVSEGAVSSSPVLSKVAQQFKNPELLKQIGGAERAAG